ncbi:putative reverse transcriptase domain, ribonuclease H-like domain, aspartic peptidase domain protein [Tanacetum coccineum]
MSDMTACLNDLSYIPLNNEQNTPTRGDIGETSNDLTQDKCNKFAELYASANKELYPGCDYVTRLDFMAKFTYFKVKGKLTDSIFNEMLEFFQNVFPTTKGYKLPPSYYVITKTFKMIRLCDGKDSNTPGNHTAKEMTWHATGKCTEPGKMQHPVDGRAWKDFDTKYSDFAAEPRNVRLGLAADGFNPFGNLSQSYSMWPVILTTYNLPPWCETIDVATGLKFNMRAMVLWTINDFPARSSLSGWSGQVTRSCPPYVMHIEKNVLESILNTLLMNDKSKDTAKARQDLKSLGIRSGLWLGQNKNGKCSKPQAAYSFTPADRKKFCQFIKGVKLPDGFGSNFKHKVTDNDTNITGLKSHDCHIMMQRLLPYGLQQYLPPDVAKPLIELCLFFKQICSQTLMVDDMLKAQSKVIDILCNLELIYPPAFFDIMIHLVIHLPLEAIFGGPIRPRWMYPFERYMKKLKNYVRNKAKPEGSIAEGYVAEEALTFSSHYFRDVTTKFNRPDRNVDCPPPTCQFQVFKSLCKSIGLRSVIRFDDQELNKVIWYVLHHVLISDSEFPNKDMKEEFPGWFGKQIRQRHVDNDPGVNESSELFALACGPSQTPISVNSCVVNGVRFVVHSRDERRTTQNSGICSPGPDGEMYYGQLEQILEFSYLSFKTVLFRVKWFDTSNKGRIQNFVIRNNITQIKANGEAFKNDQYILATQVKQCFYLEDMARRPLGWKVIRNSLSTSLNDLEIAALHIDGQSIDVDAPPDIIDVVDEDDDIIDEEDPIPHDLADSDDEDNRQTLILIDGLMSHGVRAVTGGGDDVPSLSGTQTAVGLLRQPIGKGTRKPNLGGRRAGRLHTRQETRNLGLKAITDKSGPVPIRFEVNDRETLMPLGDHAAHWANYLGELVRELPLHYPSWRQMPPERKAGVVAKIGVPEEDETYDLERLRRGRPSYISEVDWDAQLAFWNDPKNLARAVQNKQNRAKSKVVCRQGSRSIAALRDMHMETLATREYLSLIHTFFLTHIVGGVFLNPEDKALYDEMLRLQGLGSNTPTGVPYTEDEIMAIVRGS